MAAEIRKCEAAGFRTAALTLSFVMIDTVAYLGMPEGRQSQGRAEFIGWVDTYLKGHPEQTYQYRGIDVYGARCAVLHTFGSQGRFHDENPDARIFGYTDGGRHLVGDDQGRLVLIGLASFYNDVVIAVEAWMGECGRDAQLRARAEARLAGVLATRGIA